MTIKADLNGKVAFVTGATSGLGRRMALVLAENGAKIAITGRRVERLNNLKSAIEGIGGTALPLALDVTDVASIDAAVRQAEDTLGPVDILINNSGISEPARAVDTTEESYDRVMGTNTKGAFFTATAVARRMIANGTKGRIINIASMAALTVEPGLTVYCMSKAAVAHMTKALAREWALFEINVTAICPGYIDTEINHEYWSTERGKKTIETWPRKRVGVPEDLDGLVLLLSSDDSRFMTGGLITVEDAQSFAYGG